MNILFSSPEYLILLVLVPVLALIHFASFWGNKKKALQFANFEAISKALGTKLINKNLIFLVLRTIIITSLVLGLSGLTIVTKSNEAHSLSLVMAMDVSGSMLAKDYSPNRLEAEKKAALDIINNLEGNVEIGITSFTGLAFLNQPLTKNKEKVKKAIQDLNIKRGPGTALGSALVTSVNTLLTSKKPKIIVLFTDGQSNAGYPLADALNFTKENHVTVNTIGIGTKEGGSISDTEAILKMDEKTLLKISNQTDGEYKKIIPSVKTNFTTLFKKSEAKIPIDLSSELLIIGILLLAVDLIFENSKFKIIPY